MRGETVE